MCLRVCSFEDVGEHFGHCARALRVAVESPLPVPPSDASPINGHLRLGGDGGGRTQGSQKEYAINTRERKGVRVSCVLRMECEQNYKGQNKVVRKPEGRGRESKVELIAH